ncbi:hypothetical protein K2173_009292 [Erythroxylum novogranatense]|uniref:Uncharacterized protein n=1 Tax=Erythroxylum novogranatense TaxID=1862640 RepID=A0AAV8T067_9ROSI|nr:hypothetical protein K2173_009292 [Erythroxylum novogranatense]
MTIHVDKISQSMVKPSSPTPNHLRRCQLSSLDQVMVGVSTPGRVVGNSHVDCIDEGVPLVEAKGSPCPWDTCAHASRSDAVDLFDHDNVAIGLHSSVLLSEKMMIHVEKISESMVKPSCPTPDHLRHCQLSSLDQVMVGVFPPWFLFYPRKSNITNTESNVSVPRFDTAKYFPPINVLGFDPSFEIVHGEHNLLMRKYLFNAISLAVLQDRYTDKRTGTGDHRRPTRNLALTTFIWERFLAATQTKPAPDTVYVLRTPINLRSRMEPPLPRQYIGNFVYEPVVAVLDNKAMDSYSGTRVINQMRETIRSVDKGFVKRLEDGEEHLKIMQDRAEALGSGKEVPLPITSCLFPVYETDFGWGKPLSVSLGRWPYDNLVLLIPAKEADGIQVYLSLKKEDMFKFERDPEINALASPNRDFHQSLM